MRSFHAASISLRNLDSVFGSGLVAITSNPRARYWAAQLAPMTPVPIIAIRRTVYSTTYSFLLLVRLEPNSPYADAG